MHLQSVTAPTGELISLAEAKASSRVDHETDNALITRLIAAAIAHLDGKNGTLNRALLTQQWALSLDGFPGQSGYHDACRITLPLPPLQSIQSIGYVDSDGANQTIAAEDYQLVTSAEPGYVVPAYGKSWPLARSQPEAVTISFTAGYGDAAANVPEPIRHAILLMVGAWYEHREEMVIGQTPNLIPLGARALLDPFKIWSL